MFVSWVVSTSDGYANLLMSRRFPIPKVQSDETTEIELAVRLLVAAPVAMIPTRQSPDECVAFDEATATESDPPTLRS